MFGVSEHGSTKGGETSLSPVSCHSGLPWEAAYGALWKNKLRNVFLACREGPAPASPVRGLPQHRGAHVTAGAARQAAGRAGVQELGLQPTCPSDMRQFWALKPFLCVMGHGQGQLRGPLPEEALGPHFCVTAHGAGSL